MAFEITLQIIEAQDDITEIAIPIWDVQFGEYGTIGDNFGFEAVVVDEGVLFDRFVIGRHSKFSFLDHGNRIRIEEMLVAPRLSLIGAATAKTKESRQRHAEVEDMNSWFHVGRIRP